MEFKDALMLIAVVPAGVLLYLLKVARGPAALRFSSTKLLSGTGGRLRPILAGKLHYLRFAAAALFIIALARPRLPIDETKIRTEGINIVLTIDASGSMLAEDFTIGSRRLNRLEVVKNVVKEFIERRKSDMIGMVAFAAEAYTVCPLTLDYDWLEENLKRVEIGSIEDGTAIGSAVASSLNRLKDTEAKSKVVILLTDGINNTGGISPMAAAEAAEALGIKIYTIGAGTKGVAPYPVRDAWGRVGYRSVKIEIDEKTLKDIARVTGGTYFRATDTESLKDIYRQIDEMERVEIEQKGYMRYNELFGIFLLAGLAVLLTEVVLSETVLRRLP